jgi:peroxiredoxin
MRTGEPAIGVARRRPGSLDPRSVIPRGKALGARRLADRLIGLPIPSLVLNDYRGEPLDLRRFADAFPLVIYLYPGCSYSPGDGEQTRLMDAMQHQAFRDCQPDLLARTYRTIAISSQSSNSQCESVRDNAIEHKLLCDPDMLFGKELGLPTFEVDRGCWYQRLTLVTNRATTHQQRTIAKAFSPVLSAARNAEQVIAWMQVQGDGDSGCSPVA